MVRKTQPEGNVMTRWTRLALAVACCAIAIACSAQANDRVDDVGVGGEAPAAVGSDLRDSDVVDAAEPPAAGGSSDTLLGRRLDGGELDVLAIERPVALWMWTPW